MAAMDQQVRLLKMACGMLKNSCRLTGQYIPQARENALGGLDQAGLRDRPAALPQVRRYDGRHVLHRKARPGLCH